MGVPDRQADEDVLRVLALHAQGLTPEEISDAVGIHPRGAQRLVTAIVREDCAHDPEASDYWQNPKET